MGNRAERLASVRPVLTIVWTGAEPIYECAVSECLDLPAVLYPLACVECERNVAYHVCGNCGERLQHYDPRCVVDFNHRVIAGEPVSL